MNILVCAQEKGHPQRHSLAAKVSKNDVGTWLWNITVIDKTLIEKRAQDDLSFNKRQYKCIYQKYS